MDNNIFIPLPDGVVEGVVTDCFLQVAMEDLNSWNGCLERVDPVGVSLASLDVDVDVDWVEAVSGVAKQPPAAHVSLDGRVSVLKHSQILAGRKK